MTFPLLCIQPLLSSVSSLPLYLGLRAQVVYEKSTAKTLGSAVVRLSHFYPKSPSLPLSIKFSLLGSSHLFCVFTLHISQAPNCARGVDGSRGVEKNCWLELEVLLSLSASSPSSQLRAPRGPRLAKLQRAAISASLSKY